MILFGCWMELVSLVRVEEGYEVGCGCNGLGDWGWWLGKGSSRGEVRGGGV